MPHYNKVILFKLFLASNLYHLNGKIGSIYPAIIKCRQFKTIVRSEVVKTFAYILLSTLQIWKKHFYFFIRTFLFAVMTGQSQKCDFLSFSSYPKKIFTGRNFKNFSNLKNDSEFSWNLLEGGGFCFLAYHLIYFLIY